jgi:hypothetical protein
MQARAFKFVHRFVRALSRHAREQADLFLAELNEITDTRVQVGVEQARQTARDRCAAR